MKTEHFRKKLQTQKDTLELEMGSVGRRNLSVPNDWEPIPSEIGTESDLADQADLMINRESNAAILSNLEARYDSIIGALSRIEKKIYGRCEVCGKIIEEARLEADPSAQTCIEHL